MRASLEKYVMSSLIIPLQPRHQYRQYYVRDGEAVDSDNRRISLRFCDSRGLETHSGLTTGDIVAILDGHLQDQAQVRGA